MFQTPFSTSFLTLLLYAFLSPANTAQQTASLSPYQPICETSLASPPAVSVISAAKLLMANPPGRRCVQSNTGGSKCTTIATYDGAKIGLCGNHKSWLECEQVGKMVVSLALYQDCSVPTVGKGSDGGENLRRFGGQIRAGDLRVIVFS